MGAWPVTSERIARTVLKREQVVAIAQRLNEPYSTLVLLLAVTGLRIGEAIGRKWSDFEGDVLKVQRRIYAGEADDTKTEDSNRSLPSPHLSFNGCVYSEDENGFFDPERIRRSIPETH